MTCTHDSLDGFLADVPPPGTTPGEHLSHTLASFAHLADTATLPVLGGPIRLLRTLDQGASRAELATLADGCRDEDYAVTATWGVYGADARTGLTWADVRSLIS